MDWSAGVEGDLAKVTPPSSSTGLRLVKIVALDYQEAEEAARMYAAALKAGGFGPVTTEIAERGPFFYAEDYHQQYLAKNPGGYCGLGGTGVTCPVGAGV